MTGFFDVLPAAAAATAGSAGTAATAGTIAAGATTAGGAASAGKAALLLSAGTGSGITSALSAGNIGLALSGASTVTGIAGAYGQAQTASQQAKTQNLYADLDAAQRENENQRRLMQAISTTNNFAASAGLNPNAGSLMTIKKRSYDAAEADNGGIIAQQIMRRQEANAQLFGVRNKAFASGAGGIADFGMDFYNLIGQS